jgi:hypothetical protein
VVTLATLPELENSEPIDNDMSDPIPKKVSRMGERQTPQEGLGKSLANLRLVGWKPKIRHLCEWFITYIDLALILLRGVIPYRNAKHEQNL